MTFIRKCFQAKGCRLFMSFCIGTLLGAVLLFGALHWRPFCFFSGGGVSQLMDELLMKDRFMTSAVHEYPSIGIERTEGKLHWTIYFMDRLEGASRAETLEFLLRYRAVTKNNELQQMVAVVAGPEDTFRDIEEVLLCIHESGLRYVWLNGRGILRLVDPNPIPEQTKQMKDNPNPNKDKPELDKHDDSGVSKHDDSGGDKQDDSGGDEHGGE